MGKRRPVPTPEGHQQCHQCLAIKPHADFEPCRWRVIGIKATCRPCLQEAREDREGVARAIEESVARIDAKQYAPTIDPNYVPPLPVPEADRKTDEYFRRVDAGRRQHRLRR